MPAVKVDIPTSGHAAVQDNALPELLQTPAGLALIEIQGTIHAPFADTNDGTQVGRLEFPLHDENAIETKEGPWRKKVYLYIGKHQRLRGEVKKLPKPLAVLGKDHTRVDTESGSENDTCSRNMDRLQILAIVRYKILFSSRPEPVGIGMSTTAATPSSNQK